MLKFSIHTTFTLSSLLRFLIAGMNRFRGSRGSKTKAPIILLGPSGGGSTSCLRGIKSMKTRLESLDLCHVVKLLLISIDLVFVLEKSGIESIALRGDLYEVKLSTTYNSPFLLFCRVARPVCVWEVPSLDSASIKLISATDTRKHISMWQRLCSKWRTRSHHTWKF